MKNLIEIKVGTKAEDVAWINPDTITWINTGGRIFLVTGEYVDSVEGGRTTVKKIKDGLLL